MSADTEYKIYWEIDFGLWSGYHDKPFSSDFVNELLSIEPYFQSSFGITLEKRYNCDWWSDYEGTWGLLFEMEKSLLYGEFISSLSRETIDDIASELFKYVEITKNGYVFKIYYEVCICDIFRKLFFELDYEPIIDLIKPSLIEEKDNSFRLGLPCFYPYKFINHDYRYENAPICGFVSNDIIREQFDLFDLQIYRGEFAHVILASKKRILWSNVEFPKPIPKILKLVMFLLGGIPRIKRDYMPCSSENYIAFLSQLPDLPGQRNKIKELLEEVDETWQQQKEAATVNE